MPSTLEEIDAFVPEHKSRHELSFVCHACHQEGNRNKTDLYGSQKEDREFSESKFENFLLASKNVFIEYSYKANNVFDLDYKRIEI